MNNNSRIPTIIPFGSDEEMAVMFDVEAPGIDLDTVEFKCTLFAGRKSIVKNKADLKHDLEHNEWIIPLETKDLAPGDLWIKIEFSIPDEAFSDGIRNVIVKEFTGFTII